MYFVSSSFKRLCQTIFSNVMLPVSLQVSKRTATLPNACVTSSVDVSLFVRALVDQVRAVSFPQNHSVSSSNRIAAT
jgi:hypothetical protein